MLNISAVDPAEVLEAKEVLREMNFDQRFVVREGQQAGACGSTSTLTVAEANTQNYDPNVPPDPVAWLALDELIRIEFVEVYHRDAREKLPNLKAHAVFQAIVENQIAEGLELVVRAMERLAKQGLSRHDALHAIGTCLVETMNAKGKNSAGPAQTRYDAAVEQLTAKSWRRNDG